MLFFIMFVIKFFHSTNKILYIFSFNVNHQKKTLLKWLNYIFTGIEFFQMFVLLFISFKNKKYYY